jgi:subtilisin family serine protease
MAAPGSNMTLHNASYGYISGTSMAAAEVSGAAALILSTGYQSVTALKADILNNVDAAPSLSALVRTVGRLHICKALAGSSATYTLGRPWSAPTLMSRGQITSERTNTC